MKNKIIIAVLALACIVSVGFNIYQYNQLNISQSDLSETMAQLDGITNSYIDLQTRIESLQQEVDSLNVNINEKQSEADGLAKENEALRDNVSELEKSIEESKGVSIEEEVAETEQKADTTVTETTTSTKSTETAQAVDQTTSTSTTTTQTSQNQSALQAEMLQKAASMGAVVGGNNLPVEHAGNSTHSTGAVWE